MRINIVHMGFFYSGGGERVVLQQARHLRERGHTVKVYSPITRRDKCFPQLLKDVNPEELMRSTPSPVLREALAMLLCSLLPIGLQKLRDCDVLLCHSQPSMWIGWRMNQLFGIPYVGYLHQLTTFIHKRPDTASNWATKGDFLLLDGLLGTLCRPIAQHLDYISHKGASHLLFNSDWTRSRFQQTYGLTGDVCYPALDNIPDKLPNKPRENMIITASRHYPWKRIDLAFDAISMLPNHKPQFVVVGDQTPHTASLKRIVSQLNLNEYVSFTGFVTNTLLTQLYSQSSAYVQTSINEPFGLGPLEAQAYGTPAVVWGDAGVRETVLDGESGFHAKPYDLNDFVDKLESILVDKELWHIMSRTAHAWASIFTWKNHIDHLEHVMDELC
jgi:glycosyltransferase involved in cell wall biosynthesis